LSVTRSARHGGCVGALRVHPWRMHRGRATRLWRFHGGRRHREFFFFDKMTKQGRGVCDEGWASRWSKE
jgi:hypothetical protein